MNPYKNHILYGRHGNNNHSKTAGTPLEKLLYNMKTSFLALPIASPVSHPGHQDSIIMNCWA